MSDTPRTDAEEWITRVEEDDPELGLKVEDVRVVDADFARELERELAAAKAELSKKFEELAAAWMVKDDLLAELAKVRQQRDEAKDTAATHKRNWYEAKTEYGTALGKVRAELAAAIKQRDEACQRTYNAGFVEASRIHGIEIQQLRQQRDELIAETHTKGASE